jgi:membrane-bound serine protease (ClpP class)
LQFVFTAIAGLVVLLLLSRFVPRVGPARRMVLQPSGAPPVAAGKPGLHLPAIGAVGEARSPLRPAGTAEFHGALVDVVSSGEFVAAGDKVRVIAVEGERVTVAAADAPEASA